MDELKACPFCGNDKIGSKYDAYGFWHIGCGRCEVFVSNKERSAATTVWNTRTPALPDPCTVEQWEEITGETFPDDGAVWARWKNNEWKQYTINGLKRGIYYGEEGFQIVIVQTGKPAPKDGE